MTNGSHHAPIQFSFDESSFSVSVSVRSAQRNVRHTEVIMTPIIGPNNDLVRIHTILAENKPEVGLKLKSLNPHPMDIRVILQVPRSTVASDSTAAYPLVQSGVEAIPINIPAIRKTHP